MDLVLTIVLVLLTLIFFLVTPGPGTYVAPSAFGVYVGERALLGES